MQFNIFKGDREDDKRASGAESRRLTEEFRQRRHLAREAKGMARSDSGPKGRMADVDAIEERGPRGRMADVDAIEERGPRGRMAEAGQRADPVAAPKQPPAQDVGAIIQQAVKAGMGEGVTREQVRHEVREILPRFLQGPDPQPPIGDTSRAVLGFENGHAVWRTMPLAGGKGSYHFKGRLTAATTLTVRGGTWTRNGIPVTLAEDGEANVVTVGANDYVWLLLTSTAQDPALKPDGVELAAGTLPTDAATEGIHLVLGKMTSGVWEQWHYGGDHDDWVVVPDAEHNAGTDVGTTKTVQFNPDSSFHAGELQLFDVGEALDQQMLVIDAYGTLVKANYQYAAMIKTTEAGPDPFLTEAGTGPEGGSQAAQFTLLRTRPGYDNVYFTTNGTKLTLNYQHIPVVLADGRVMFDVSQDSASSTEIDLAGIVGAHNHDGDYAPIDHDHTHDDISDWADYFKHQYLVDIVADADLVDDHDGRYWPCNEVKEASQFPGPDTKSYHTTGTVAANKLVLYGDSGIDNFWNRWESTKFTVAIGVAATLVMDADIALATTGSVKIDTLTGRTVRVRAVDPDTGAQVTLKFYKGFLVEE